MNAAVSNLRRLRVACNTRELPADLADWLSVCLDDLFQGRGSMDECIGLVGRPGKRSAVNGDRLRQRDMLIHDLAHWSGHDDVHDQARAVACVIQGGAAPFPLDLLRDQLAEYDPPTSARQIARILSGNRSA